MSEYLTTDQAVHALQRAMQLPSSAISDWLKSGNFPGASQNPGGNWRFNRADVLAMTGAAIEDVREGLHYPTSSEVSECLEWTFNGGCPTEEDLHETIAQMGADLFAWHRRYPDGLGSSGAP